MIIKCPLSWKRRNPKWYENWTPWFAWYPVRIDEDRIVWLQTIERKDGRPFFDVIDWEYRLAGCNKA